MEQKPLIHFGSLVKGTWRRTRKGFKVPFLAGVVFMLSVQSAQAEILDQLRTMGGDVESWANIIIPTVIVFSFIGIIWFACTRSPRWKEALGIFVVACILWGGLDEIIAWSHKIGGGDGTINVVGIAGGGGGGGQGGGN